ncbi:MAG: hypothetical protein WBN10_18450 [Polyangiales bacterium]
MNRTWLILISALAISACSESGTTGSGGAGGAGGSTVAYPLLDCDPLVPEFCGYPFPSNVYTVEDSSTASGRRVSFGDEFLRNNDSTPWDYSDGFSAGSPILTYLPRATDAVFGGVTDIDQSLSASSPTLLLDAETGELVPHFAQIDTQALQLPGAKPEESSSILRPVVRLRDDARYIVAFRNVTNPEGAVIAPSAAFAALRDGTASDDESVEARRALYEDIFEKIEAKGWSRDEIQIAWDFNTASDANNTRWLLHMRDTAFELIGEDGPDYTITSVEASTDDGAIDPANIAFRIFGTFRVPLFMTSPEAGSLLILDENEMPMINEETPWADVPFEVLIPQSATAENPAATIEYGHGLFGSKGQIESSHFRSFMNQYNFAFFGTDMQGMSDPDETAVREALASGKFSSVQTMWDRLHQGFLNHLVMLRMMKTSFAQDPMFGQYIDADKAFYHGISQGGIMGPVILATSPDIDRGALGVMGQPYSFLLFRSVDFDSFLLIIRVFYSDYRMNQLLIGMSQMLWDRVEPNGYSHHIVENNLPGVNPKEVLMRTAIGDHQVTTFAGHIMARTMNAKHLTTGLRDIWELEPVPSTASGTFYTEYDFGLPGQPYCNVPMSMCDDPHEYPRRREASRKQLDEFLRNGTGTNFCAPGDADEHQVTELGVCSYPSLSGCDIDETDAQDLCIPDELP